MCSKGWRASEKLARVVHRPLMPSGPDKASIEPVRERGSVGSACHYDLYFLTAKRRCRVTVLTQRSRQLIRVFAGGTRRECRRAGCGKLLSTSRKNSHLGRMLNHGWNRERK
jgi:hypothetical protein